MTTSTDSPDFLVSLARWLHGKIIILEMIALFVFLVMMFINVKSGSELGWITIIPLAFLMFVLHFMRHAFEGNSGIPYIILRFNNFACKAALFAIICRYLAMFYYNEFLQGAALLLAIGLVGIIVMKLRNSGNNLITTEVLLRTAVLETIIIAIQLVPGEKLLGLGFALG